MTLILFINVEPPTRITHTLCRRNDDYWIKLKRPQKNPILIFSLQFLNFVSFPWSVLNSIRMKEKKVLFQFSFLFQKAVKVIIFLWFELSCQSSRCNNERISTNTSIYFVMQNPRKQIFNALRGWNESNKHHFKWNETVNIDFQSQRTASVASKFSSTLHKFIYTNCVCARGVLCVCVCLFACVNKTVIDLCNVCIECNSNTNLKAVFEVIIIPIDKLYTIKSNKQ